MVNVEGWKSISEFIFRMLVHLEGMGRERGGLLTGGGVGRTSMCWVDWGQMLMGRWGGKRRRRGGETGRRRT